MLLSIPEWTVRAYGSDARGREASFDSGLFVDRDLAERCAVVLAGKPGVCSVEVLLHEPGFCIADNDQEQHAPL